MNSALQMFFTSQSIINNIIEGNSEVSSLFKYGFKKNVLESCRSMIKFYGKLNPDYNFGDMIDCSEFIISLFEPLKINVQKFIIDNEITYSNGNKSIIQETNDIMPISIKTSIVDGIIEYLFEETEDNIFKKKFTQLGDVFIVTLNRFKVSFENGYSMKKDNTSIEVQETISILENNNNININLVSVIFHIGTPERGHYYAYVKRDNKWYECNDMLITEKENPDFSLGYIFMYSRY